MNPTVPLLLMLGAVAEPVLHDAKIAQAAPVAVQIDTLLAQHWSSMDIQPVGVCDDTTFLRRVTLDLAGRIPTFSEAQEFAKDQSPDKRKRVIRKLMTGSDYPSQMARILDGIIQDTSAGEGEFVEYLRSSIREHKSWDQMFREMMSGPWDTKEAMRSMAFIKKRIGSVDDLTTDTSRVFFGVNVSCAKCHDHPLVEDWKQEHYFGMASFFNRTVEGSKKKKKDEILEADTGEVQFLTTKGERKTAKVMFLSSKVIDAPKDKKVPLREELVKVALADNTFFRRAIVNRLWANLMGRGLVDPVDQLHSANPPAIPNLLEWLGDDFAKNGYDLDRVVAGLVMSKAYQRDSRGPTESADEAERAFGRMPLRALSPYQFSASMILANAPDKYDVRNLQGESGRFTGSKLLDIPSDRFQSSAGEALYLSNHPEVQKLVQPNGSNLVARLVAIKDSRQLVDTAIWTILSRAPEPEEYSYLASWIDKRTNDKAKAISQMVWALMTSAEFRFNH